MNPSQPTEELYSRPTQQSEVKLPIVQKISSTRMALRDPEARASFLLCSIWAQEAEERETSY